jgi:type I restriction enzyme S subunit
MTISPAITQRADAWLGAIPASWPIAPLYARYSLQLGKMLDASRITGKHLAPYVRNIDVQWDRVSTADLPEMDFEPDERDRFRLVAGDLLICEGGEAGRTALWRGELRECYFQKAIHRLRPHSDADVSRYFYWLMVAATQRGAFVAISNANTIDHLTAEKFRRFRFPFPLREDQQRIADFLDRKTAEIDALIAKKERMIALLHEKRQAVITQSAINGLDATSPRRDSGVESLGPIPSHWMVCRIATVATKITNGFVGPTRGILFDDGVRYLQSLHIKNNRIRFDVPYFVNQEWSREHSKSVLRAGDVLIVQTGDIGQVAVVTPEFAGCNCHALIIVACHPKKCRGEYLSWLLNSQYGFDWLKAMQTGALHPHLNCTNIRDIPICVPPLHEQDSIIAHIVRATTKIEADTERLARSIRVLTEYRRALISEAVVGRVGLSEIAKDVIPSCGKESVPC